MGTKSKIVRFMHCKQCVQTGQSSKIEVGLANLGPERGLAIQVWCKRHDREVGAFTPSELAELAERMPPCDCCPGGLHSN